MAGEYEKAITIEKAVHHIVNRSYLLPAIQRKFTWSSSQICVLFDSIMRGYPINTFMFWEVRVPEVKKSFRFYQFLERYCERFEENNPDFDTKGHGDFFAVIDGQQRLTSLYIGLKGTYAYKLPRKWWPRTKDNSILPPRKLYLNLAAPLDEDSNEEMMKYEFKFLTVAQIKEDESKQDKIWFQVGEVLDFDSAETDDDVLDIVMDFLQEINQESNKYARKALTRLYFAIRRDSTIHFYNEANQSIDHVLDIFIRTNHGGTPLAFSDLLMSIAVANWKKDARQQIDDLVDQVRFGSDMEFSINRDFVLKTALMLSDADVRFKVKNFTGDQVAKIEQEWDDIKICILEVFRLIRSFGLNDAALRAKNAAIPIAYYLFHTGRDKTNDKQGLYNDINNRARNVEERKRIRQWLHMSLLKGVFGGQGDTLLTNLRKIILKGFSNPTGFPLDKIVNASRGTAKDLTFDDDFIDRLLKTQKDDSSCFSILALLFPDLDFTQSLDIDHLHPAASFKKKRLDAHVGFSNPTGRSFYENPENWNSIVNLHLLNSSKNKSKQDQPLDQWLAKQNGMKAEDLLIPTGTNLSLDEFESFVEARTTLLKQKLSLLVGTSNSTATQD
jgi:uncharacterized protein with ParB-like and HNH nuclease domain